MEAGEPATIPTSPPHSSGAVRPSVSVDEGQQERPVSGGAPSSASASASTSVGVSGTAPMPEARPFYGGFRNKETGVEYYHACTQTEITRVLNRSARRIAHSRGEAYKRPTQLTRESQTRELGQAMQQTNREAAIQPPREDILPSAEGREVIGSATRYETSDAHEEKVYEAAIVVQSMWRRRLAMREYERLYLEREERETIEQEREQEQLDRMEAERLAEMTRRMHPRTRADFDLIRAELTDWLDQQRADIDAANFDPDQRHAALRLLLDKEVELLQRVELLRIEADKANSRDRITSFLDGMAAPLRWPLRDGSIVNVHTPYTQRAADLRDLHMALSTASPSTDTRLDTLLHVKWTVKEFDSALTRDIIALIDREADMLSRDRPAWTFKGMRKRLLALFLQFCECPDYNPSVLTQYEQDADTGMVHEGVGVDIPASRPGSAI
ncbi:hypothetical protein KIPB_005717 [Kipferlia bialata]|uniref:IQ motif and ubiquitin-like domain-containing protein n=1 Tax=Kipferlia bialata TaxID=797122 RepID=A0A9K3CXU1_9EUKA|nr:hypothetical protein KIPB_005717 [Kipferlia bialata]|eukprot:g5717.t1